MEIIQGINFVLIKTFFLDFFDSRDVI